MGEALHIALGVARQDRASREAPPPPTKLTPLLRFRKLPDRALDTLAEVLDSDDIFRQRVVESLADPDQLEESSRLFLLRPDGWEKRFGELEEEFRTTAMRAQSNAALEEAQRRVTSLESGVERIQAENDGLKRQVADLDESLVSARTEARTLRDELDIARGEVAEVEGKLAKAIRQLKESEALATERLEDLRELQSTLDQVVADPTVGGRGQSEGSEPTDASSASMDGEAGTAGALPSPLGADELADLDLRMEALETREDRLERFLTALATALEDLRGDSANQVLAVGQSESAVPDPLGGQHQTPGGPANGRRVSSDRQTGERRIPLRIGRGVVDDSIEGLQALLQQPRICVFVDGYNVSKSAWPRSAIAEQRILLVSFLGEIRTRFGPEIHVVFDGDSRGERPTSRTSLPVRVHFTSSGVEADDRILEFLEQLDSTRPALVITSDQRVRNGARARGANVVSSAVLLKLRR